jgi:hypothetical protein
MRSFFVLLSLSHAELPASAFCNNDPEITVLYGFTMYGATLAPWPRFRQGREFDSRQIGAGPRALRQI